MTRFLRIPSSIAMAFALLLVLAARPVAAGEGGEYGTLVVEARDTAGGLIPAGCYEVDGNGVTCDEDGDGQLVFVEVEAGERGVSIAGEPFGFRLVGDGFQVAFVEPGATATVVFVFEALPLDGAIVVEARDENGELPPGGCYAVDGPVSSVLACDNGPDDHDPTVGWVEFGDLPPGDWVVSELSSPEGYHLVSDPNLAVWVESGATAHVVYEYAADERDVDPNDPDFDPEVQPPDPPYQPVEVTPTTRISLTPTCAGVQATIVAATSATGALTKIVGTNGDDVIVGTVGPDRIAGLGGHDLICSLDGADEVDGGAGDDRVDAGPGDDTLAGNVGADRLDGGAGKRDSCDGGPDKDVAANCESMNAIP